MSHCIPLCTPPFVLVNYENLLLYAIVSFGSLSFNLLTCLPLFFCHYSYMVFLVGIYACKTSDDDGTF